MKRVELLAPAGSMEALQAAIQNGCDAVYLGGSAFGARAFANNFDREEMLKAIAYAHGYGVKLYVTMNTLIMEDEMEDAIAYAKFLYEHHIDALIIQDIGLFDVLHQMFPDLELHASTQMHIHNEQGIHLMQDAGAKRVVVPRETSIEEISEMSTLGVDLEVFVQGALCVSYSGQCLMSSMKLDRSGNRGECAQMCRMRYRLGKEEQGKCSYVKTLGEYILSPRDLNTLNMVPELIQAGIASFKIEGRMKRPAYVALMVSKYREAIDAYYHHQKQNKDHEQIEMRKMFNREFTTGHLFHQGGKALMNFHRPNHMGISIGKIENANKEKVSIRLSETLRQGDGIRFLGDQEDQGCLVNMLYKKGLLVKEAHRGDVVELKYSGFVQKGSSVVKTSDKEQLDKLQESWQKENRKVDIYVEAILHKNKPFQIRLSDDEGFYSKMETVSIVEQARTTPLSKQRLEKQIRKCGDSIFQVKELNIHMEDDASIAISEINLVRRNALENLYEQRRMRKQELHFDEYHREVSSHQEKDALVVVHRYEQYLGAKQCGMKHIFVDGEALYQRIYGEDKRVFYHGPRVMKHEYPNKTFMFCENGGIASKQGIADRYLNICNSYSAAFLFSQGVKAITLSSELSNLQEKNLLEAFQSRYHCDGNFIHFTYGFEELMISDYCMVNACEKDTNKRNCGLCKGQVNYFIEDVKGQKFAFMGDEDCRMHILDSVATNHMKQDRNIRSLLYFTKETQEEVMNICKMASI